MRHLLAEQRVHLALRGGSRRGSAGGAPASPRVLLELLLRPRRRQRRARRDQVLPLERRRVEERGHVRLPRLDALGRRQVGDVGGVVLVGERREVMAELVDEDVRRPDAVGGDGAVEPEDAATAVGRGVGQDLDDVVRRVGGDVAERPVVEREDVALGAEGVVGRADRRAPVDAVRRPRDARLRARAARAPRR